MEKMFDVDNFFIVLTNFIFQPFGSIGECSTRVMDEIFIEKQHFILEIFSHEPVFFLYFFHKLLITSVHLHKKFSACRIHGMKNFFRFPPQILLCYKALAESFRQNG